MATADPCKTSSYGPCLLAHRHVVALGPAISDAPPHPDQGRKATSDLGDAHAGGVGDTPVRHLLSADGAPPMPSLRLVAQPPRRIFPLACGVDVQPLAVNSLMAVAPLQANPSMFAGMTSDYHHVWMSIRFLDDA